MFIKNLSKSLLTLLLLLMAISCTTPVHKAVRDIRPGMEKTDVLEILGGPTRTTRALNGDRWTYETYSQDKKHIIDIYFHDGKVSHIASPEVTKARSADSPQKSDKVGEFIDLE